MKQSKRGKLPKLSKGRLRAVIIAAAVCALVIALVITDCFIPVKYLASYFVLRNKGAKSGVMRVRFIDVGYGDCAVVELPDGKNMLIDGGDGTFKNEAAIFKFLNKCDIDTIDYLVCTSVNNEQCGGLAEIVKNKKVEKIFMPYCKNVYVTDGYRDFVSAADRSGAKKIISEYGAGEVNEKSDYFFTFLSPSVHTDPTGASEYENLNENPSSEQARNDASAVMWLEYGGVGMLFLGDVESGLQKKIVSDYNFVSSAGDGYCYINGRSVQLEKCKLIKAANHGNVKSACAPLYDLTKPQYAVVSVGQNGKGCPSLDVMSDAIEYAGDNFFRTDCYGTVTFEIADGVLALK